MIVLRNDVYYHFFRKHAYDLDYMYCKHACPLNILYVFIYTHLKYPNRDST